MKIIKNIYLFILLISSVNIFGQSVTFQSYMQTLPWADQVLLNGNPLVETSSGVFEIPPSDVLPEKNIIEFVSINTFPNGATTLDLVMIRRAIFGIQPLESSGIIGADLNHSNFVGIEDVAMLRNRILGWDTNSEFAFIHPSIDLSSLDIFDFGSDVYKFCFNGSDFENIDFTFNVHTAGDVNQSAGLKPNLNAQVRSDNMILSLGDGEFIAGESFEIPFSFSADEEIEGLQIALEHKGIIIESIELDTYDHEIYINNTIVDQTKMILISDNPSKVINGTIIGKSFTNANLSEIISISSEFNEEVVYTDLSLSGVSIAFGTTSVEEGISVDNLVIFPNPVHDYFSIQIPSNLLDRSSITITNSQGQVVLYQSNLNRNLLIDKGDLGASGMYILSWSVGNRSVHKKLIVL